MSLVYSGESCVYCKAKLFDEDDVVYCPVCGAPHHRECYNALGHCALEQLHGTENEYSREKELEEVQKAEEKAKIAEEEKVKEETSEENSSEAEPENVRCKMCGEEYPYKNPSCPKCGAPNFVRINGTVFDFLGGVPAEQKIAEDITAEDARKFVISNTHRYIPKFVQLEGKRKRSWNWMAFLFPSCWSLSRKLYKIGIITSVLLIIATLLIYPFYSKLFVGGVYDSGISSSDLVARFYEAFDLPSAIAAIIGFAINITVRILTGIYGDYWYKNYTISSIKKIRLESTDFELDYRKKGGVSIFLFFLGYLLINYLPQIILSFI